MRPRRRLSQGKKPVPVSEFSHGFRFVNDWMARWKVGEYGPNEKGRKRTLKDI